MTYRTIVGPARAPGPQVVTYDATAAAGSMPDCSSNVRTAFTNVLLLGRTAEGRDTLQRLLRLCDPLPDQPSALAVAYWLQVGSREEAVAWVLLGMER